MPTAFRSTTGRADQREKNVEVVNHHVIHYVNIQAARGENAQAVYFEEHGLGNNFQSRGDRGIEAFEMPNLQNAILALRRSDQAVGFRERGGHGLFHQYVHAPIEQAAADAAMILGGDGEAHGINFFHRQRFEVANDASFEFGGDLRGAFDVGIHHADQFHAFHFGPHPYVVASKIADADNRNA